MRFSLLGYGYWGRHYVRLLQQRPSADLVAVADLSRTVLADAYTDSGGVRVMHSAADAIASNDVDAVVIATPAATHFELALAALRAGKHVLCEKPLTTSVIESEQLVHEAEIAQRVLFVGHTFLYSPAIQKARQLLASHALGDSVHAHAAWTAPGPVRRDVSALWDLAPHPLSILVHLLETSPTSISATGQAILGGREDIVQLHISFGKNVTADVHLSWLAPNKIRVLTLTGDQHLVVFDDGSTNGKLQIFDLSALKEELSYVGPEPRAVFLPGDSVDVPVLDASEPLAQQLDHFIECCENERGGSRYALAGIEVTRLLEAAQSSLANGGRPVGLRTVGAT